MKTPLRSFFHQGGSGQLVASLQFTGEGERGAPYLKIVPFALEAHVDVYSPVPTRFRPTHKVLLVEQLLDGGCDIAGRLEVVFVGRVEVDSQLIGVGQIIGTGIPGIQVNAVHLRHPDHVCLV